MVMLAPAAHDKNLDLVTLVYNDVPNNLMGDPLRLKQIITNLLNNAIKFTHAGEVVLRASLEEEATSHGSVTLRISVADTGMGLSRAQQRPLFDAFSQADASTARQYGGTGLGLAISKRLAEEMGGKIGLESDLGKGSTFWFTLTSTWTSQNDSNSSRNGLRGERVIYLEQQKTTGLAMEHLLRDWGVTVERVSSLGVMQERIEQAQREQAGFAVALHGSGGQPMVQPRIRLPPEALRAARFLGARLGGSCAAGAVTLRPVLRLSAEDGWHDTAFSRDLVFTASPADSLALLPLEEVAGRDEAHAATLIFFRAPTHRRSAPHADRAVLRRVKGPR